MSGKYCLGMKQTLKSLRQGKAKLIIIASNCPQLRKSEIEYYAIWRRPESTTTTVTTSSWEPLAVNTSASASSPSLIQVTLISFDRCPLEERHKSQGREAWIRSSPRSSLHVEPTA